MKIRSKAPLRLGISGGGTDVSPYSDIYGGAILNATINLYATTFIESINGRHSYFSAIDLEKEDVVELNTTVEIDGNLSIHRAVYKRVMETFNGGVLIPVRVATHCDVPPGSGLGSSSALVVSMLEGYKELLSLPLGEYDLALLAYEIERNDCGLQGGKQDQYAASFGGFNFMEFGAEGRVTVNPLRIRRYIINEIESSLIMFYTGQSRDSAKIIGEQIKSLDAGGDTLTAMHEVKRSAFTMKNLLLKGDIEGMGLEFKSAWEAKKATSSSISNPLIEEIESKIYGAGAISMKVSGAGGGGFMMIFVKPELKFSISKILRSFGGSVTEFNFTTDGVMSWRI